LKSAFIHGLRAEFQDWVAPQHPEALDDAVALALSWERAEGLREARRVAKAAVAGNGGVRCGFCGAEGHEEPGCEVRKRMMESWLRSSSNGRGSAMLGKVGEEAEEGGGNARLGRLGSAVSARSAQCQCRKHRCWKKAAPASEVDGGGEANGAAADK
uniref:SCAN box domain-containing protein n=1 Tax=Aegilops tauschii subsp. strangulata TaxID=200361 RepID=A0A453EF80_AEGTS